MFLLELCQLLLSPREFRLCRSCVLFGRHVVQHYDVALLKVETIQMVQRILGLLSVSLATGGGSARLLTSMTSSKTTNAVPLVFGSFPMRI